MAKKLTRIKVVLVEKGISQTELAEILGKSFSTVNAYCANRQQPSLEVLAEIADFLSVSIKDLILDSFRLKNDF
jgi:transcriptional regulator with XRE-family HTH domain